MENAIYTLITGASKGLGKALAIACAKRNQNLILLALPGEYISQFASYLTEHYNIKAFGFEADLTRDDEIYKLVDLINKNYDINILINNAGIGGSRSFQEVSTDYLNNILLLNIRALVILTHNLLTNLKKQPKAYILNIASMASFGPMPYKTVYPASKAFVYSFSRGLYEELKGTNILVSVAHPGGMATNPDVTNRINQYNRLIRSTILSPEYTAEIIIRQLLKNDALIIPGIMNKISWLFFKLCPVWLRLILFRISIQKEIKSQKQFHYAY